MATMVTVVEAVRMFGDRINLSSRETEYRRRGVFGCSGAERTLLKDEDNGVNEAGDRIVGLGALDRHE